MYVGFSKGAIISSRRFILSAGYPIANSNAFLGSSELCRGGIGIWKNGKLYISENFVEWKIIANGFIRTIFELAYNAWDVDGLRVSEVKRVTLDAGSNLNRFDSTFKCDGRTDELTYAVGIALAQHEGGTATPNKTNGWLAFWEPSEQNGALGCGIVVDPASLIDIVKTDDHNIVLARARSGEPATYYTGAGWDRSGDFGSDEDWNIYLDRFAKRLASPLKNFDRGEIDRIRAGK